MGKEHVYCGSVSHAPPQEVGLQHPPPLIFLGHLAMAKRFDLERSNLVQGISGGIAYF